MAATATRRVSRGEKRRAMPTANRLQTYTKNKPEFEESHMDMWRNIKNYSFFHLSGKLDIRVVSRIDMR